MRLVMIQAANRELPQVAHAVRSPRRFACGLDCRKQQRHEHGNDRYDDQQLHEGKGS